MYRLINYFFGLVVIYLFILEAGMGDHAMIITGLCLSAAVAFLAFTGKWITLDATKAVIVLGTIVLGFGGWFPAIAIVLFFISGSLLTKKKREPGESELVMSEYPHYLQNRRDGYQVWANGFWIAVFCFGWFLIPSEAFLVAAFAAIATATADTWATEIGTMNPGKTLKITSFTKVEPGTDGGISLKGTTAAIFGALLISLVVPIAGFTNTLLISVVVFVFGIAGCFIDSLIGAVLADRGKTIYTPDDYSGSSESFTNSFVNWASTGMSGLLAFLTIQILL